MINVSAKESLMKVGPDKGEYRFVLQARTYNTLSESKVISEASVRTGLSKHVLRACWEGCSEIISAWATEGHSIPLPGLGHMRFGIRATAVEKQEEVSAKLITSRRVIFNPSVSIKEELAKTGISITCYDRYGKKIKTVTSTDKDDIEEDNGSTETNNTNNGGTDNGSTGNGGTDNTNQGNGTGTIDTGGTTSPDPSQGGENDGGD